MGVHNKKPDPKRRKENPRGYNEKDNLSKDLKNKLNLNPFIQLTKPKDIEQEVWDSLPEEIKKEIHDEHRTETQNIERFKVLYFRLVETSAIN